LFVLNRFFFFFFGAFPVALCFPSFVLGFPLGAAARIADRPIDGARRT
jgi:hypothetical protein